MADDNLTEDEIKKLQVTDEGALGETPGYKPPAPKALDDIKTLDADDESLNKYKEQLLGKTEAALDEGGLNVLVKNISIRVAGRDDDVLDLTGKLDDLKVQVKEGIQLRLVVGFRVQREIVAGLRFNYKITRKGVPIITSTQMVGSYAPKTEAYSFVGPEEEIASGFIARGSYNCKCLFTDDDKHEYLKWEFKLKVSDKWEK